MSSPPSTILGLPSPMSENSSPISSSSLGYIISLDKEPGCARCNKPSTIACNNCGGCPASSSNNETSVLYCSEECMEAHRGEHVAKCLDRQKRRALFRMMSITQEIFYVFREHTFDRCLRGVRNADGKFQLHEDDNHEKLEIYQDVLQPFPEIEAEQYPDKQSVKKAILAHYTPDAVGLMHGLVEYLFTVLARNIREHTLQVNHYPKRHVLEEIIAKCDKQLPYVIFEIAAWDGLSYAFDLTAAKAEWPCEIFTDCIELQDWCMHRAPLTTISKEFGHEKSRLDSIPEEAFLPYIRNVANTRAADCALEATKDWETREKTSLYAICRNPDQNEYDEKVGALLRFLGHTMKAYHESARNVQNNQVVEANGVPLIGSARMSMFNGFSMKDNEPRKGEHGDSIDAQDPMETMGNGEEPETQVQRDYLTKGAVPEKTKLEGDDEDSKYWVWRRARKNR